MLVEKQAYAAAESAYAAAYAARSAAAAWSAARQEVVTAALTAPEDAINLK